MHIKPINAASLQKAAALLQSGRLVAFPTETVYGLGADAADDRAVAEIFAVKGRPQFNPLIVHVASVAMAQRYGRWNARAEALARSFWPAPLTLVLPRVAGAGISLLASAGGETVALRMPAHNGALALIAAAGVPVAAPSANRSGRISPTTAQAVYAELGDAPAMILDGGPCAVGIESTVIDLSLDRPVLLRPGFITQAEVEAVLKEKIFLPQQGAGTLKSPGQLAGHYAPGLGMRLGAACAEPGEALLAFGLPLAAAFVFNLSASGDLKEAAARLFLGLRALDRPADFTRIAVMPIPEEGIGIAINDRLKRAAHR